MSTTSETNTHEELFNLLKDLKDPCSMIKNMTKKLNTLQHNFRLSLKIIAENKKIKEAYAFGKKIQCIEDFFELVNNINKERFIDAEKYPKNVNPCIKIKNKNDQQGKLILDNLQVSFDQFDFDTVSKKYFYNKYTLVENNTKLVETKIESG